MSPLLKICIGDIVFGLYLDDRVDCQNIEKIYQEFLCEKDPDITLEVHRGALPDLNGWENVFDSEMTWSLWHHQDRWAIQMRSPVTEPNVYQVGVFENEFERGKIYLRERRVGEEIVPFAHVFAEVLTINRLALGYGVLLHACAVKDGPAGRLFTGVSGAGKSTISHLWGAVPGVEVLSDDRVIIRKRDGRHWIYGTPWHGDAMAASREAAPIEQLFILEHAQENRVRKLSPTEATSKLLVRAFPTYWSAGGMAFILDFLSNLGQTVPCYELGFVPTADVVDFIRCVKLD
jgi:hypothetical protein